MNENNGNKRENVGAGGNTLEYKRKKWNLQENVEINNIVDIKGSVWCHVVYYIGCVDSVTQAGQLMRVQASSM